MLPDAVTVQCAFEGRAAGYPIVVGEVSWSHDGLVGSVQQSRGRGVFAIVRLPRPYPSASVQRRRLVPRRRAGEDEFLRQFRIDADDLVLADQLTASALHEAHVTGRIPPWTIAGDELYTVLATRRLLRPPLVTTVTEQVLLIVRFLGIRADGTESIKRPPESRPE